MQPTYKLPTELVVISLAEMLKPVFDEATCQMVAKNVVQQGKVPDAWRVPLELYFGTKKACDFIAALKADLDDLKLSSGNVH